MKKLHLVPGARKGFTLLEALFAVLIIAILAAVAVPMYSNTKKQAAIDTCLSNVRAIATAESKFKFETGDYVDDGDTPTPATALLNHGLAEFPKCPNGNTYTVTKTGTVTTIKCSDTTNHTANKMDLND